MKYVYLLIAILSEVAATTALKASDQFSRLWPSVIVVLGYASAFYFMSMTLKSIPVGVTYAIWSGVGIILISVTGYFFYQQKLDTPAMIGMAFIIAGVLIINLFSKTTGAWTLQRNDNLKADITPNVVNTAAPVERRLVILKVF